MMTHDNKQTAKYVASKSGILSESPDELVVDGRELVEMIQN